MTTKPLAVSMGDPAGIGLELAARVLSEGPRFVFCGDANALARAARRIGVTLPHLECVDVPLGEIETPGAPSPANAPATIAAIEAGVEAVRTGKASGLVTLPIDKAHLYAAGFTHPGHTEFIADRVKDWPHQGARGPVMMLAGESLRVALATIHTPLARVKDELSVERIITVGRVVAQAMQRDYAIPNPRIALCGFNPHAGEQGAIGREEIEIINPAASVLRAEGYDVSDAKPADSLFHHDARARYDAVIAMYHDQGLIPLKTLHFWDAANITLGLPIVRASPDHGVGYDIAGKGVARADSFREALRVAASIAARRTHG